MIFLTIGTHEPFDRLVRAVDEWAGGASNADTVFGQITSEGAESYRPRNFEWVDKLTPDEYGNRFEQADLIVSHAGMGSILTALQLAKPIVIMPRRGHLRETRNDHQYTTVQNIGERAGIYVAETEVQLPGVIDLAVAELSSSSYSDRISEFAETRLTDALKAFIHRDESSRAST